MSLYTYDAASRPLVNYLGNGSRASTTYDNAGQPTKVYNLRADNSVIAGFDYVYDPVGNRTRVLESSGDRTTWAYDKANQLRNEHRTGATAWNITHTYDPVGNRTVQIQDGARTTYAYNAATQIRRAHAAGGITTFGFDAAGNQNLILNPDGSRNTYTWDIENRRTAAILPTTRETMTYNAAGLRNQVIDPTSTTRHVWDNQNLLAEFTGGGSQQALYTSQPAFYGNLLSQRRSAASRFHHFDALGSTARLTDRLAAIDSSYTYHAYGSLAASTGSAVNPFTWVGRLGYQYDPTLLQYYVRARHYDPRIARWLSVDPAFVSYYDYASNSPLLMVDPSGEIAVFASCLVGGVIGAVASVGWDAFRGQLDACRSAVRAALNSIAGCLLGILGSYLTSGASAGNFFGNQAWIIDLGRWFAGLIGGPALANQIGGMLHMQLAGARHAVGPWILTGAITAVTIVQMAIDLIADAICCALGL